MLTAPLMRTSIHVPHSNAAQCVSLPKASAVCSNTFSQLLAAMRRCNVHSQVLGALDEHDAATRSEPRPLVESCLL